MDLLTEYLNKPKQKVAGGISYQLTNTIIIFTIMWNIQGLRY